MFFQFKKSMRLWLMAITALLTIASCQKEVTDGTNNGDINNPDLTSKVTSSASGFVTDENNDAVTGATVQVGTSTTTTDEYGYFSVSNVQVTKNAATVTVTKAGYFKGIKTYIAENNKAAFFRIKLIPKTTAGTITSSSGGNVTLANGLTVALPADAVVNAGSGAAYSGAINVAAYWIDPTATDLYSIMPGDLRALNESGALQLLKTYGMAAVELSGAGGEALQIAPNKKATLTFPVPASLNGTAPASIPLWYFDETLGLWKEEGSANKTGSTYVGEVSHFSFWNCDVPNNYVQVNMTLVDPDGEPLPYAAVSITDAATGITTWGFTDSTGYVGGAVPNPASLTLNVLSNYGCPTTLYTQTFSTSGSNVALGTITVPNSTTATAQVTGTVTDCVGAPVTNGYIIMEKDGQYYRYAVDNTGAFDLSIFLCSGPTTALFIAEDIVNGVQSSPVSITINVGANALGNIQACGVSTNQFLNNTIDGVNTVFTAPADSLTMWVNPQSIPQTIQVSGSRIQTGAVIYQDFSFTQTGIAAGSTQQLLTYANANGTYTIPSTINVNITEYGIVGEFIAGNFTGTVVDNTSASRTINCSFRVRRTQ